MIYFYVYFRLILTFLTFLTSLGVYQVLNCLVYWPIHFIFSLVSNFQLYLFLTTYKYLKRLSVPSINPSKKNGITVRTIGPKYCCLLFCYYSKLYNVTFPQILS